MRTLKTIVITLGIVLVAGFGVLVFGLTQNWHRAVAPAPAAVNAVVPSADSSSAASSSEGWGRTSLGLPADSRVQGVTPAGNLIVVQVVSGGAERLLILDPANGRLVGTFALADQPATERPAP